MYTPPALGGNYTFSSLVTDLAGWTGTTSVRTVRAGDVDGPIFTFTGTSPASGDTISGANLITLDILEPNLGQFIWTRGSTGYSFYDSGLVAMYNFDNIAALGENTTTIKDLSAYSNTGTAINGATRTGNGRR